MLLNELFDPLVEGPRDPHIFKAIFMLGGPGSGKSTIAKKIAAASGLRYVNLDDFFEMFAKKMGKDPNQLRINNPEVMARAGELAGKKMSLHTKQRMGLLIDGTGRNLNFVLTSKELLDSLGYDTMAIFVNTDPEIAAKRNSERARQADPEFLKKAHAEVRANLGGIQSAFDQFLIIDNNDEMNVDDVWKKIQKFINGPISYQAKMWTQNAGN